MASSKRARQALKPRKNQDSLLGFDDPKKTYSGQMLRVSEHVSVGGDEVVVLGRREHQSLQRK